ncbi:MAG: 2-amino-4-hydroxy-6-hydroxymethyldihydropteridine diphosphokinase [Myxococcota bacterium]
MMRSVVIGVGANLGSREASVRSARMLLAAHPHVSVEEVAPLYETAPVGPTQPDYLNTAFRLATDLRPPVLLDVLLDVERRLGRDRSTAERWGARSLDLDYLWDDHGPFEDDELVVPHRELRHRPFALGPLLDVAPELIDVYGAALQSVGGAIVAWDRAAREVVVERSKFERAVEADSLADACALAASFPEPRNSPTITRQEAIDSSGSALADALNRFFERGFETHHVSISHCSHTQWVAHFHGVNVEISKRRRVSLSTTSGDVRAFSVRMSVEHLER